MLSHMLLATGINKAQTLILRSNRRRDYSAMSYLVICKSSIKMASLFCTTQLLLLTEKDSLSLTVGKPIYIFVISSGAKREKVLNHWKLSIQKERNLILFQGYAWISIKKTSLQVNMNGQNSQLKAKQKFYFS